MTPDTARNLRALRAAADAFLRGQDFQFGDSLARKFVGHALNWLYWHFHEQEWRRPISTRQAEAAKERMDRLGCGRKQALLSVVSGQGGGSFDKTAYSRVAKAFDRLLAKKSKSGKKKRRATKRR